MDIVIIGWIIVFCVALVALVKGADWLLMSAERIGLWWGLSPFIVGVVITGLGTSFPEFISSVFAVLAGAPNIVPANAIGSNIANIFLVIGISALVGKRLSVTKSLIDLDIPLLAASTVLFVGVAFDGVITPIESGMLFAAFIVYFIYTFTHQDETEADELASSQNRNTTEMVTKPKITTIDFFFLFAGLVGLALGAKYLIDSVIELSQIFNIATGVIALIAIAIGTSLPELLVSAKAAMRGQSEMSLGNIFGSNAFNLLFVVGIPGLFVTLPLDQEALTIGLPFLVAATVLFVISGISRRVHVWEGAMYVILYVFFVGKLFGLL